MTKGMIFGLIVSTGLTLFVIPSLYVFTVQKTGMAPATVNNIRIDRVERLPVPPAAAVHSRGIARVACSLRPPTHRHGMDGG